MEIAGIGASILLTSINLDLQRTEIRHQPCPDTPISTPSEGPSDIISSNPSLRSFAYVGCFPATSSLSTGKRETSHEMTQESCFNSCTGYAFAGLRGEECFCFDRWMDWVGVGERDTADGMCNIRRPGDKSQMCGGDTKNAFVRPEVSTSLSPPEPTLLPDESKNALSKRKENQPTYVSIKISTYFQTMRRLCGPYILASNRHQTPRCMVMK